MSVAAAATTETRGPSQPMSLVMASYLGGIYVIASLAVIFFAVPALWQMTVGSALPRGLTSGILRGAVQTAVFVGLVLFGIKLAGVNPPAGMRGGVFLAVLTIASGFFLVKWTVAVFERMGGAFELGHVISLMFFSFLLFLFWKYLKSDRMSRWAVTLESAGWFEMKSYKRNQGMKVRRLTILGVLLVCGSGIYAMVINHVIVAENWVVAMPFTNGAKITLLPDIKFTIPGILVVLSIWFSWRLVNQTTFADFLIATEAEMNKVSWTPRPKLIKDTIVVLTTVFIITMFLFVVDIFWGFLLSREIIGVLPGETEKSKVQTRQVITNEW